MIASTTISAAAGMLGKGLHISVQAGLHVAAGGISGAINAGITGGNVMTGLTLGAVPAGAAKYMSAGLLPQTSLYQSAGPWGRLGLQGLTAVGTGSAMGGVSSVMMGGDFLEGAARGAWTSAFGYLFNQLESQIEWRFRQAGIGLEPGRVFTSDSIPGRSKTHGVK